MSIEDQIGSIASRLRAIEAVITAIEEDVAIEKDKLARCLSDLKIVQDELRPKL